jgi:two-component system, OmpR family, sensor histidine kinase SaeS
MRASLRMTGIVLGCFLAAGGLAVLLFVEWLHAPRSHVIAAVEYLGLSGLFSLAVGTLAVLAAARWAPRLGLKMAVASLFGGAVAIINVLVTPLLMFQESSDRTILVITLLYFFVLSIAFAALVAAITTRRLTALHEGAIRLASGDLGTRVAVHGADEVADLSRAFNQMSTDLSRSFERERRTEGERRQLIAAVSHDLRTPVASIRAMTEAITDGIVTDGATVSDYLGRIHHETERLATLIDDLFEVARIESGNLELRLAEIPVGELVADTVGGLGIRAAEKGVALSLSCTDDLPSVAIDAPRMQRVFANLIENAVRHTPPGGQVRVGVRRENGHVEVAVEDTGEGISPEDQPHVFDRFFRGERSRSRDTGGAGLGLAIARGIVEAHRGTLLMHSEPGKGSTFVVRL